jgi:hypothetical protein
MVALARSRLLLVYVVVSAALVGAVTLLQYYRYDLFGTDLMLGWDSPRYVWAANEIMTKGSLPMIKYWSYPHLYAQLLAFLGYVSGNVVVVERILPLVFFTLLIYANAAITARITKNVHVGGLAALLTVISINALRLYADLNRNLMVLSLSFASFLLISDFVDQNGISRKSLLSKTYLSIIAIFLIVAGTQLETFLVLALTSVLIGIMSRSGRKLAALALIPAIPIAILLAVFPQLLSIYISQMGLFTQESYSNEVLLWIGGSWILFGFLVAGTTYLLYRAVRQRNTLASAVFSWTAVTAFLCVLTMQRVILLSTEYALRALLILPVPVLFASVVFALGNLLKDTYFEIGMSSSVKRHAFKVSLRHVALVATAVVVMVGSLVVTSQHYDEFLTPYVARSAFDKIQAAGDFMKENGFSSPLVVVLGENAYWFGKLYDEYLRVEVGGHFYYRGDISSLLFSSGVTQSPQTAVFGFPILLISPDLYDRQIPYYLTQYHIGQGIYVIPPRSLISSGVYYGPTVTVTADGGITEVRSEYLYADQNDPSLVVLRVTTQGYTSYTFENYPQDWVFLKLEQGGALSYPEKDPRRFDGARAVEGNDPAESTQDWGTSQTGTLSIDNSVQKEGQGDLKIEGFVDSWGNLGTRYNPQGIWDLSQKSSLAVWGKASENAPFSMTLTDSTGNTRTYWDIKPDGTSATLRWRRFAINLSNYTSQNGEFDLSRTDSVDFYIYSNPGRQMTLWIDDIVIDEPIMAEQAIYKARVSDKDLIVAYFAVKIN